MNMVYEKLLEWPAGCVQELTPIDTQNFFVLCGMLAKYETRPKQELLDKMCIRDRDKGRVEQSVECDLDGHYRPVNIRKHYATADLRRPVMVWLHVV